MSQYKCEECKDTKELLVQNAHIGRAYMDAKTKKISHDICGFGDWHKVPCYCLSEGENE